jgi:Protein of unknown function (DUF732)
MVVRPMTAGDRITLVLLAIALAVGGWVLLVPHHPSNTPPPSPTSTPYDGPRTGGGDAEFLSIAKSHIAGLTNKNGDAGLTALGKAICQNLNEGSSRESVFLTFVQGNSWSDSDASWIVTSAVVSYCPAYILPSDRW